METEKSAGAIIYYLEKTDKEPKFLLLKSTYWGFVKGWIEQDLKENIEQTIIREAKEEANITQLEFLPKAKFIQNWIYKREGKLISKQATFLVAKTTLAQAKQAKISFEHNDFGFFTLEQALSLMKIKQNKELLQKAYNLIKEKEKQSKLF